MSDRRVAARGRAGRRRAGAKGGARGARTPAPASRKPLHVECYERIKHEIITLHFRPGEYLNEAQVSELLGIGRTPVHQALNRLMLEGMVEVIPRKGVIVKAVSLNEILDIIDVRAINETYCARLAAARASESDAAELDRILAESEKAAAAPDTVRQMLLDRDFHSLLSRIAGNVVLGEIMRSLHERSLRFWFISLRDPVHHARVKNEHRAIVDAIKAHDPDAAERAVRNHIESSRTNIMAHILGSGPGQQSPAELAA
ncbi:MAG: GntR family transcriptional regulator [Burkholderiales bacterium]|nr:GntR family transcriptional regulator [Burkholderiales bacterium]